MCAFPVRLCSIQGARGSLHCTEKPLALRAVRGQSTDPPLGPILTAKAKVAKRFPGLLLAGASTNEPAVLEESFEVVPQDIARMRLIAFF